MVGIVKYPEGWYVVDPTGEPYTDALSKEEASKVAEKINNRLFPETDEEGPGYTQSEMADDWNTYDYE